MSKDAKWSVLDENLPDSWEALPEPGEVVQPSRKRSFARWHTPTGEFPQASQAPSSPPVEQSAPGPYDAPAEAEDIIELTALDEYETEAPEEPDQRLEKIHEEIFALVSRLPSQHAPPLHLLDAALTAGLVTITEDQQLNLFPLQSFFQEHVGWSEHKFQTFCTPLVSKAEALGLKIHFQSAATELPDLANLSPMSLPASPPAAAGHASSALQREVQKQEEQPLTAAVKRATIEVLAECVQRSALKVMLNPDVFDEYLEQNIDTMWQGGSLHLQQLWDELQTIPMVSEPIILSAFLEIDKHKQELPIPVIMPSSINKSLAQAASAPATRRKTEAVTPAPQSKQATRKPQRPKPKPSIDRPLRDIGTGRSRTRLFLGIGFFLFLALTGYYYFFLSNTVDMKGQAVDPKPYEKIIPLQQLTFDKTTATLYAQVHKKFLEWPDKRRIDAIFQLQELGKKNHKARRLWLLTPRGELFAELGR